MKIRTYALMSVILWLLAFVAFGFMVYEMLSAFQYLGRTDQAPSKEELPFPIVLYKFLIIIIPFYLCSLICLAISYFKKENSRLKYVAVGLNIITILLLLVALFKNIIG